MSIYPFLEKEIFYILPTYDISHNISLATDKFRKDYDLISANFGLSKLLRQFNEDVADEKNLYQPKFGDITCTDIIEVRSFNEDQFRDMQHYIAHDFIMEKDYENRLLYELSRIDLRVKELNNKFNNLRSSYRKESLLTVGKLALHILKFAAKLCPPAAIIAEFIDAGKPLADVGQAVKNRVMHQVNKDSFMDQDFYLYWRIKNPRTTI